MAQMTDRRAGDMRGLDFNRFGWLVDIAVGLYLATSGIRAYVLWMKAEAHDRVVSTGLLTDLAEPFVGKVGVLTLWLVAGAALVLMGVRRCKSTHEFPGRRERSDVEAERRRPIAPPGRYDCHLPQATRWITHRSAFSDDVLHRCVPRTCPTALATRDPRVETLRPVSVREPGGHKHIPPIELRERERGEKTTAVTRGQKKHRTLYPFAAEYLVLAAFEAVQQFQHSACLASRKVTARSVSQPIARHRGIMPRPIDADWRRIYSPPGPLLPSWEFAPARCGVATPVTR